MVLPLCLFLPLHHPILPKKLSQTPPSPASPSIKIYFNDPARRPSEFNRAWLSNSHCASHFFTAELSRSPRSSNRLLRPLHLPPPRDFFFIPVYVSCNFSASNGFTILRHARPLLSSNSFPPDGGDRRLSWRWPDRTPPTGSRYDVWRF
ncbi:putative glucuronoxylan glucuronosyltransferase F8H [Platanthera zijinensis]|uniref:Glucuronoxylan glucuronosyltransferase F8H n=1 Tax=Platanthera zijinensis TaxID=2320716 RepID=A0AAP0BWL4_9ASPA